jgi:hypothetical protein
MIYDLIIVILQGFFRIFSALENIANFLVFLRGVVKGGCGWLLGETFFCTGMIFNPKEILLEIDIRDLARI